MIKPFNELLALDLDQYISKKPSRRKNKRTNQWEDTTLDYLSWASCLALLHLNGATQVTYGNIWNKGHLIFTLNGGTPYLRVWVTVDGDRRELDYPLIDGNKDIGMENLSQSDVHNATQRGFVKCVAINWGLGLSLWQKEETDEASKLSPADTMDFHNVLMVKERVERKLTAKLQRGLSMDDALSMMGLRQKQFTTLMAQFENLALLEQKVDAL